MSSKESLKAAKARGTHNRFQWEALCAEFGHRCVRCGERPAKLTKDHIIACSRGGSHTIENVQPFCDSCNQGKGSYDRTDYVAYRRRYGFEATHIPISQLDSEPA